MRLGRPDAETRRWALIVALVAIAAYLVAFIVENDAAVGVHFVFFTAHTSLIWVIVLSLLIGGVAGVLLSELRGRRRRNERA